MINWTGKFVAASLADFNEELTQYSSLPITKETTIQLCTELEDTANKQGYTLISMLPASPSVFIFKEFPSESNK